MATQESKTPRGEKEPDGGPAERTRNFMRARTTPLESKRRRTRRENQFGDELKQNPDLILEPPDPDHWQKSMAQYRERQINTLKDLKRLDLPKGDAPQPPDPPPAVNWIPIGPSVAMQGQAATRPAVSGRVARLAITNGAGRVYAATANGGVWRSDDAGATWRSTMDSFDLNPTTATSDSLACGAIAIDQADPDRVYVGTGEGDAAPFAALGPLLGVMTAYLGVGPVVSSDGGNTWTTEPVAAGSPTLNGQAFYQLAVDPNDREHVIGATTVGLYRRQFNAVLNGGTGGYEWAQVQAGDWTDVVVARPSGGPTPFVAARRGGGVSSSTNGTAWAALGTGFPAGGLGRIVLAVQPTSAAVVYALISNAGIGASLNSFQRYDASSNQWRVVTGLNGTGGRLFAQQQANYDLAITVDPANVNTIYAGGSIALIGGQWSAEVYHGTVTSAGAGAGLTYSVTDTSVGGGAHGDVHQLVLAPGSSTDLWVATDGGVFRATNAGNAATFVQRNVGLQTFTLNHIDLHPTEPAVAFAGAQDNGTLRYVGEECWLHSAAGDGGFAVVDWNNPYRVMRTFTNLATSRATDGGVGYASWANVPPPQCRGWPPTPTWSPLATPPSGLRPTSAPAGSRYPAEGRQWHQPMR